MALPPTRSEYATHNRTGRHTIQAKVNSFEQVMHRFGSAPANETVVADPAVARAAFTEAVRRRPGKIIILRQKRECSRTAEDEADANVRSRPISGLSVRSVRLPLMDPKQT